MDDQSSFLFVYGTLQPSFNNPFAHYIQRYSHYVGEGTIAGQLVDVGQYPGALYNEDSSTRIHGTVVELTNQQPIVLAYLDEYEGVSNGFAQPTEFKRLILPVNVDGQTFFCWTYLYNWSVELYKIITSGDYCQYLAQSDQ